MKRICLLGATGSIGQSTLKLVDLHPDLYAIHSLSAHNNVQALIALCARYKPRYACISNNQYYVELQQGLKALGLNTVAVSGHEALSTLAADADCDIVVAAIVGAAGVASTFSAAMAGKRILLANKESIVVAGQLLMQAVQTGGAQLFPIDSEHNAIFQCLPANQRAHTVRRLLLTASGGPFLGMKRAQLQHITPEQACKHPKWSMGQKISVDSASLMNKGLEVIEAHHLFAVSVSQIEVLIHPQSIVHSLVDYCDGSMLAQLGNPDMRTAISYGLAYPNRIESGVTALDLLGIGHLEFQKPDTETFPCLNLAYWAAEKSGNACAVLNAANEIAVELFLQGKIAFLKIPELIEKTLTQVQWEPSVDLTVLMASDTEARIRAHELANEF